MQIDVHIDTHTPARQEVIQTITAGVAEGLRHHRTRLTRATVHIRDLNGPRAGVDHRCTLEVRPAGLEPLSVSDDAPTVAQALSAALQKMNRQLASTFGKRDQVRERVSASGLPS